MAAGKEDRYGYVIQARDNHGWTKTFTGWSEGDSQFESKVGKAVAKQVAKQAVSWATNVAVFPKVAAFAAGTGWDIGSSIGQFIAAGMMEIVKNRARMAIAMGARLNVELTGDFAAKYIIADNLDMDHLPSLLSMCPATFTKGGNAYYMGAALVKTCFETQIGYLYRLGNNAEGGTHDLEWNIDV